MIGRIFRVLLAWALAAESPARLTPHPLRCRQPTTRRLRSANGARAAGGRLRDEDGKVTLRAVRLAAPLGMTDISTRRSTVRPSPIDRFEQQVPREGAPAMETTQAWILFDDENL